MSLLWKQTETKVQEIYKSSEKENINDRKKEMLRGEMNKCNEVLQKRLAQQMKLRKDKSPILEEYMKQHQRTVDLITNFKI